MTRYSLSDEETVVIFAKEARANLDDLDATKQRSVLSRLEDIADSSVPPSGFRRERIANLDVLAAGDTNRLYTKIVENVPQNHIRYHIVNVFYVDSEHEYDRGDLATYSHRAQRVVERIREFEHVDAVDEYLRAEHALSATDLADLLT